VLKLLVVEWAEQKIRMPAVLSVWQSKSISILRFPSRQAGEGGHFSGISGRTSIAPKKVSRLSIQRVDRVFPKIHGR
jgi:hypothetical protein